jgi:hypothetical protein
MRFDGAAVGIRQVAVDERRDERVNTVARHISLQSSVFSPQSSGFKIFSFDIHYSIFDILF